MGNAIETEFVGVTLPKIYLQKIDTVIQNDPLMNRQDFIREAVKEKLEGKS